MDRILYIYTHIHMKEKFELTQSLTRLSVKHQTVFQAERSEVRSSWVRERVQMMAMQVQREWIWDQNEEEAQDWEQCENPDSLAPESDSKTEI